MSGSLRRRWTVVVRRLICPTLLLFIGCVEGVVSYGGCGRIIAAVGGLVHWRSALG